MTKYLVLVAILVGCMNACASVPLNSNYLSPNRKYSVYIKRVGYDWNIAIQDSRSRTELFSVISETLIWHLEWTPASDSVMVVHQVRGGSYMSLIISQNGIWRNFDYDISDPKLKYAEFARSYVYKFDVKNNKAFAYLACQIESATSLTSRIRRVEINLLDGKIDNIKNWTVSDDEFERLLSSAPWGAVNE